MTPVNDPKETMPVEGHADAAFLHGNLSLSFYTCWPCLWANDDWSYAIYLSHVVDPDCSALQEIPRPCHEEAQHDDILNPLSEFLGLALPASTMFA